MYDPVGLSVGTTNLVVARVGKPPVKRRSVLTLFPHRAPEIGVPTSNLDLTEPGTPIAGFVERVGEPDPMVATDGSTHRPELLLVAAIDAVIDAAGAAADSSEIVVAIPASWASRAQRALRDALWARADLSTRGEPPRLVSDADAALTALNTDPGLDVRGVVALLDFGGGGTNITLVDVESGFEPIDETLRYPLFSGDLIDEAVLAHVLNDVDPGDTPATESLAQLREECRQAKERLSVTTGTDLFVAFPGHRSRVRLTRTELENLIQEPLGGVIAALEDTLERNKIGHSDLVAVAAVGGGASIPLVTQCLSSHTRVPVVTTQQPELNAASGAALLAVRGSDVDVPASTALAVIGTAANIAALSVDAGDETSSGIPRGLAWSEEDLADGDLVPFFGEPYDDGDLAARPDGNGPGPPDGGRPRRWYQLPQLVFGLGALVAMIAIGGVAYTLSTTTRTEVPAVPSSTMIPVSPSSESPSPSPVAPPSVVPTTSAAPPPPPPPSATPRWAPPPATTHRSAPTTTAQSTTTTTTTTTATPTTTPPPTTATTTTTTVPMTTEWLTVPFVPVPIPIPVPEHQVDPNQPQNPFINPGSRQPQPLPDFRG